MEGPHHVAGWNTIRDQSVLMIPKRVHTGCMGHHIITSSELLKKKRDDLRTKRDALFKTYSQPPHDFDLARQIKKIDDEVAECTDKMSQEKLSERKSKPLSVPAVS